MATITLFTLGGQTIALITQVVITAMFGAGAHMDAFMAACVGPQYVVTIVLASLSFVFIPMFVNYTATGQEEEAWQIASGVITLCLLTLGSLALGGVIFARPLLRWMIPGLSPESLKMATQVAMITWPTTVATGLVSLLTGIYQVKERFSWPAAVPVIGALVNLAMVLVIARPLGVLGIALAATTSLLFQAAMLLPIALGPGRWRLQLNLRHPGVRQVLHLLWPLVLSALFVRWTPLIDCYLASSLGEGAISHLGYAFKLTALCGGLLSVGISTVLFPRMAIDTALDDMTGLRLTVSWGLRGVWLTTAPAIFIGWALALPFVTVLFRRGQFSPGDAQAVASLFQIYLFALVGMCLGTITGRALYALKYVRLLAVAGVIEAVAYALYTPLLAKIEGVIGIAMGYVLYYGFSILWVIFFIRYKTGNVGGRTLLKSFIKITFAGMIGGAVARVIATSIPDPWLQLILGGAAGFASYIVVLILSQSPEAQAIWTKVPAYLKKRGHTTW
jgi:putative peptidoglycan lipid II flippase